MNLFHVYAMVDHAGNRQSVARYGLGQVGVAKSQRAGFLQMSPPRRASSLLSCESWHGRQVITAEKILEIIGRIAVKNVGNPWKSTVNGGL